MQELVVPGRLHPEIADNRLFLCAGVARVGALEVEKCVGLHTVTTLPEATDTA